MEEIERRDDTAPVPERVSLPSFCCVRSCDQAAASIRTVQTEDALLVYVLCADHASLLELP